MSENDEHASGCGPVKSLPQLLAQCCAECAGTDAYIYLVKGGPERITWTYRDLHERAAGIAAQIVKEIEQGERVLLLYQPGLDFIAAFFGCLYAGAIAVPAYAPGLSARSSGRIASIAADCDARLILLEQKTLETRRKSLDAQPVLKKIKRIATDIIPSQADFETTPGDVAYLQYTSGSTSTPKGVMVTHANVLHNLAYQDAGWKCSDGNATVSWMPHFHDFGLVFGILEPLFAGIPGVLLSPPTFVQHPLCWLKAIHDFRGTHTAAPNFAYELCASQISAEEREALDLSCLQVAVNGAEPVRFETLQRFNEVFAPCGFNYEAFSGGYGLAEATLKVASERIGVKPGHCCLDTSALQQSRIDQVPAGTPNSRVLVGNGAPHTDTEIVIANPETLATADEGAIGEIWTRSPSICHGYWNRPDDSRATFEAHLSDTGDGPYLRTGDLGFLHEGDVYITGRLKDLIIIRGVNHYPQDIELTAEHAHNGLRPGRGAAFSIVENGAERLVVIYETKRSYREPDIHEVGPAVRRAVAEEHELEVYALLLVPTGSIPMTSSGKIMRHACRRMYENREFKVLAESILDRSRSATERDGSDRPRNEIETRLAAIWEELLNVSPIGIHDNFFDLGGNSLVALRLAGRIADDFGQELPLADLFRGQTVAEMAQLLDGTRETMQHRSLVPLRAEGEGTPFFCIHPGGGTALCFQDLARHMDPKRPFYGLQSRGLDGKEPPLTEIETMARCYLEEMRDIQPRGPYYIGGMCFGGLIAFEMARQLTAQGETLGLIAVLDTRRPPGYRRKVRPKRLFKQWLGSIDYRDQERYLKKVWLGNEKARRHYRPAPYNGPVKLFWSAESEEQGLKDRVAMWERLAAGGLEVVPIPGLHKTILQQPHVRELARILDAHLETAEKITSSSL